MKVLIEYFNKIVDCFQIAQVVVVDVNTDAEVQASIPAVNDLEVTKLERAEQCLNAVP